MNLLIYLNIFLLMKISVFAAVGYLTPPGNLMCFLPPSDLSGRLHSSMLPFNHLFKRKVIEDMCSKCPEEYKEPCPIRLASITERCAKIGGIYCRTNNRCYSSVQYVTSPQAKSNCATAIRNEKGTSRLPLAEEITQEIYEKCVRNVLTDSAVTAALGFWVSNGNCQGVLVTISSSNPPVLSAPVEDSSCALKGAAFCQIELQ